MSTELKINKSITDRNIGVFMVFNLMKGADNWSYLLKGMNNYRMKYLFNNSLNANRLLINEMEKELSKEDPSHIEQFEEDSEVFSKVLEMIRKAETPKQKQELYLIMKGYVNGDITVKEETL